MHCNFQTHKMPENPVTRFLQSTPSPTNTVKCSGFVVEISLLTGGSNFK